MRRQVIGFFAGLVVMMSLVLLGVGSFAVWALAHYWTGTSAAMPPVVATEVSQSTVIAPVDELKPGMTGYCRSPDELGHDRLPFVIKGIQRDFAGYQVKIVVQLQSGRALRPGAGTPRGMSGSPLYLDDGRFIGALSHAADDPDNTVSVTPAQMMLDQGRHASSLRSMSGTLPPLPFYIALCTVWGDVASCNHATTTFSRDGVLYATGHHLHNSDGIAKSHSYERAAFISSVIMTSYNNPPSREHGTLGAPLGTMVWDGINGSVVELGRKPQQFTVHLTVDDGFGLMSKTLYGASQHPNTPEALDLIIRGLVRERIDFGGNWDGHIAITVRGVTQPLLINDDWSSALDALQSFLDRIIVQSPSSLDSVQIHITKATKPVQYDLLRLDVMQQSHTLPQVHAQLRNRLDNQTIAVRDVLIATPPTQTGWTWQVGRAVQTKVLNLMPATQAVSVLNRFIDRRKLYLVCIDCMPNPPIRATDEHLVVIPPDVQVRVLSSPSFGGLQVVAAPELPFVITGQEPEVEKVSKKK